MTVRWCSEKEKSGTISSARTAAAASAGRSASGAWRKRANRVAAPPDAAFGTGAHQGAQEGRRPLARQPLAHGRPVRAPHADPRRRGTRRQQVGEYRESVLDFDLLYPLARDRQIGRHADRGPRAPADGERGEAEGAAVCRQAVEEGVRGCVVGLARHPPAAPSGARIPVRRHRRYIPSRRARRMELPW